MMGTYVIVPALACLWLPAYAAAATAPLGIFEDHTDIGKVLHAGSVEYDAARRMYNVSGSGENMWFAMDAFQFAWKKVSGDVTLTADVAFIGSGGEAHPQGRIDDPPGPGRGLGLRRRGAAWRRANLVAGPRRKGRQHE